MAEKKFFVDVNLQAGNITNLKADTLDITTNLASANTKRIAYYNGSYYYSDGTSWNILATALGYTPEDQANKSSNTSLGTSNILYPTQNAVKVYADNLLGNANALIYKGVIDCSTNPNYPAADAGWMYIASVAGKIGGASGTDVEVGDMIICNTDGTVSGDQATVGQYWNIIQKNIIGAVTGPSSSVNNNVVFFDGVTGKIIKDSGLTLSGSNTGDETTATIKTKLGIATTSVDGYLTSTNWTTFNNKQAALSGTGFVKISGTTISYDNSTYLTGNQTVTLSGDVTGSGATGITTSISATTVTGKLITGFVSGAGTVSATDSILGAIQKLDGNTFAKIGGSGTSGYVPRLTGTSTLGNSIIRDNGTNVSINDAIDPTTKLYVYTQTLSQSSIIGTIHNDGANGGGPYASVRGIAEIDQGTAIGIFGEAYQASSAYPNSIYIGGRFYAANDGSATNYAVQLQDGTEGVGKFLKSITADGKANWATLSVADTGLTVTTTGTSGAATLVGNTLNIPNYQASLIPDLKGNEIWRGHTFRNNSTTFDSTAGLTLSTTGTNTARSVATTSYATRGIRMGVTASIVATGRYSGIRGGVLLWYVSGGFLYTGEFNISDTATAAGTHNFWGLASSTSDLVIGDVANSQPSALTNIIAFANDSGDANLQIMCNDATGTATKTDLGSSFPSNRTAGAAITTIYSCYLYNAPGSTSVIYRIVNKETGATAQGTLSTNLPASTIGLNFFGVRTMGTTGGGITNSGQFDVYRLGVYSL